MNKNIKVSVIVPVYNVEKYLDKCLTSLVNQTLKDIEIIVVNDGTKDNSQHIIDKYTKQYPNKVFSYIKENGGLSSARNYGVLKAHGEYLGFVDSDDYVDINMYELMYNKAHNTSSDIVVCGLTSIYQNKDTLKFVPQTDIFGYSLTESPDIMLQCNSYACNKIYKRKMWIDNNIEFPNQWFEDSALIYNALYYANKIEVVKEPLYMYLRTNENSIVNTINPKIFDIFKSCDSLLSFYKDKGNDLYRNACNLCISHVTARFLYFKNSHDKKIINDFKNKAKDYFDKHIPNWDSRKYQKELHYRPKFIKNGITYINNKFLYDLLKIIEKIKKVLIKIAKKMLRILSKIFNKKRDVAPLKDVFKIFKKLNITYFCEFNTLIEVTNNKMPNSNSLNIGIILNNDKINILKYNLLQKNIILKKEYYYNNKVYAQDYLYEKLKIRFNFYEIEDKKLITYVFKKLKNIKYKPYKIDALKIKQTIIKDIETVNINNIEFSIPKNYDEILKTDYGLSYIKSNNIKDIKNSEIIKNNSYFKRIISYNNDGIDYREENYKMLQELHKIELEILKEINKICKRNKINFYLGEGTLLGAVRHQGFIPWDDDIDLIMPREDYEKFLKIAPQEISKDFEIQHSSLIENYWSPFIKVRYLKENKFKQTHIAHLTDHNGPLIDIFPLDNVPKKDSLGQMIQAIRIKFNRGMLSYKLKTRFPKKWKGYIVKCCSYFVSVKHIHKVLNKTFVKYNNKNNPYIVNLGSYYSYKKQTHPKKWYAKPQMVKFENLTMPIPHEAKKILSSVYGKYMELPPVEKRAIKHHFDE